MSDAPEVDRPSTRPYFVLRSRFDDGVYEYVATIEAGDADRAIKSARGVLTIPEGDDVVYRDEWHAIPSRYWTTLNAETVVPPPETTWSQGTLPGTPVPDPPQLAVVPEHVDEDAPADAQDGTS